MDIGNTCWTIGYLQGSRCVKTLRLPTHPVGSVGRLSGPLSRFLTSAERGNLAGVIFCSVVPAWDAPARRLLTRLFNRKAVRVGDAGVRLPIRNRYRKPLEVGADRLVDAVAAHQIFRGPLIVVDFGTATTFDCVTSKGDYLGGAIAPGPEMALSALSEKTARLPRIHPRALRWTTNAMGRTTRESMRAGFCWGYAGLVEKLIRRLRRELGGRARVIATGGFAGIISPRVPLIDKVAPDLTLQGLRLIWARNVVK